MRFAVDGRYIQDHFPGIGRYTYNLVCALAEEVRHEELFLLHNPRPANTRYDLSCLGAAVSLVSCQVPAFSLREQTALPRLVRRLKVDLLHSTYYIKPYWLPVPSVLTYYDVIGLVFPSALPSARGRLIFRLASRLALAAAAKVILLSEAARGDVVRYFGVSPSKTAVVYPAADPRFAPQPSEAIARIRTKYGLAEQYALYLGITKPHKNVSLLLDAWARVRPQAQLVLAGPEDTRYPYPRERACSLGLEGDVVFLGGIAEEDLPALYSGAALFAFPSLYEGFGLPVLEAMACGVPVLSSDAASLPEVVGNAGVLLPPTDLDAWAHALEDLLSHPAKLEEMRRRSLARAASFSWEQAARETLAVYREVLA
jgi:alpha-1,3-rhamnosyl/mannosyltransferase